MNTLSPVLLLALDWLLLGLHLFVIAINAWGWWPRRTRRLQRWTLLLTAFSWLGCGAFYGWGYCFLTDWHWDIKRARGETELPHSFLQYILQHYLDVYLPNSWVDGVAAGVLTIAVFITLYQLIAEKYRQ